MKRLVPQPYYTEAGITIYHGDCREIMPHLERAAVMVSDVPYGIAYETGHRNENTPWQGQIANDGHTAVRDAALALHDGPALIFGSRRMPTPAGTRAVLIWDKGPALGMGALDIPWKPSYEEIYVIGKGWKGPRNVGAVIYCPPVQSMAKNGRVHPNEKPVKLMQMLLQRAPDGLVIDPCMGSGSTLVAAKNLGVPAVGIELEEKYCEIAARRLAQGVLSLGNAELRNPQP